VAARHVPLKDVGQAFGISAASAYRWDRKVLEESLQAFFDKLTAEQKASIVAVRIDRTIAPASGGKPPKSGTTK